MKAFVNWPVYLTVATAVTLRVLRTANPLTSPPISAALSIRLA